MNQNVFRFGKILIVLALAPQMVLAQGTTLSPQENLWADNPSKKMCELVGGTFVPPSAPGAKPRCDLPQAEGADLVAFCNGLGGVWNTEKKNCALLPTSVATASAVYVSNFPLNRYFYREALCSDLHFMSGLYDDNNNFDDVDGFKCASPGVGLKQEGLYKAKIEVLPAALRELGSSPSLELFLGPPLLEYASKKRGEDDPTKSSKTNAGSRLTVGRKAACDAEKNELMIGISSVNGEFTNLDGVMCARFESPLRRLKVGDSCHYLHASSRDGGPMHPYERWLFECRKGYAPVGLYGKGTSGDKIDADAMKCCPYSIEEK